MASETPKQPYVYEGMDPEPHRQSALQAFTEAVRDGYERASEMFDSAKKPGMPLSVLSNIAREAPLGTLFAAFLVGVMVGRRG